MSADANDNVTSKFPRASLRARNRTIVMAPADVEDFKPEPRKTKSNIKIEDFLEDTLSDESSVETRSVSTASALDAALSEALPDTNATQKKPSLNVHAPNMAPASDDPFALLDSDPVLDAVSELQEEARVAGATHEGLDSKVENVHVDHVAPIARIVRTTGGEGIPSSKPSRAPEQSSHESSSHHSSEGEEDYLQDPIEELAEESDPHPSVQRSSHLTHSGGREYVEWRLPSRLIGFLVSFQDDHFGAYVELREGRLFVSCERGDVENCLVISDPSVSSMHAILRISADGTILILDQLSEHGTRIKRSGATEEQTLLGEKGALEHGDVVIFGECAYHVCVLKGTEQV